MEAIHPDHGEGFFLSHGAGVFPSRSNGFFLSHGTRFLFRKPVLGKITEKPGKGALPAAGRSRKHGKDPTPFLLLKRIQLLKKREKDVSDILVRKNRIYCQSINYCLHFPTDRIFTGLLIQLSEGSVFVQIRLAEDLVDLQVRHIGGISRCDHAGRICAMPAAAYTDHRYLIPHGAGVGGHKGDLIADLEAAADLAEDHGHKFQRVDALVHAAQSPLAGT